MRLSDTRLGSALDPLTGAWDSRAGVRDAAVLAPLLAEAGADSLLYTQRHRDLAKHAGELSFPGGSREGDEAPARCALREAQEEIGLDPAAVTLLGSLPPVDSSWGYRVHPVVGRLSGAFAPRLDPREVDKLVRIPLAALAEPARWEWRELPWPKLRRVPFFPWEDVVLWGLTGRLTHELLRRAGLLA